MPSTPGDFRVEPLAAHPDLMEQAGLLRWREWAYGNPDPGCFIEVTVREAGPGGRLPVALVAIDAANNAAGVVSLGLSDDEVGQSERRGRAPWILGMVVREDVRGLGVGRHLLESLQGVAASFGYPETWVATGEEAEGFYRRCGWSAVEHLCLQSTGVPTAILTKRTSKPKLPRPPDKAAQPGRDASRWQS